MQHSFDIDIAKRLGVDKAILIHHLGFWLKKNAANNNNLIDGNYWTYNSSRALQVLLPYFSEKKIGRMLKELEALKVIKSGNYNTSAYDRTKWYSITDKCILGIYEIHSPELSNGVPQNVQPIPDSKPDSKPIINSEEKFPLFCKAIIEAWEGYAGQPQISMMRAKLKKAEVSDADAAFAVSWFIAKPEERKYAHLNNMRDDSFINAIQRLFANAKAEEASKPKELVMPTDHNLPRPDAPPPSNPYIPIPADEMERRREESARMMREAGLAK